MIPLHWRLQKQKYSLVGSRCGSCSRVFFPVRRYCISCQKTGLEEQGFAGAGVIESFTMIHAAPAGFRSPYVVGVVRLDGGPCVVSQIVGEENDITIGSRVSAVFRRISAISGGVIRYGLKFEVV